MTNDELITKFNPANAGTLSEEDLTNFRALTTEQIGVLAKAYPNSPSRRPYLVLFDHNVKPDKQLYSLSTYQNLYNVRKFSNLNSIVPYDFKLAVFPIRERQRAQVKPSRVGKGGAIAPGKKIVVDLSANEAADELTQAIGGPKKVTSTPVVNMNAPGSSTRTQNPAQDAIDKAIKKPAATKKLVTEKTTAVKKSTRGKVQVDVAQPGEKVAEPGADQ